MCACAHACTQARTNTKYMCFFKVGVIFFSSINTVSCLCSSADPYTCPCKKPLTKPNVLSERHERQRWSCEEEGGEGEREEKEERVQLDGGEEERVTQ